MSSFGEPWVASKNALTDGQDDNVLAIYDATGNAVAGAFWYVGGGKADPDMTRNLAARIAVCVNFLAGVPTEDLQPMYAGTLKQTMETIKIGQRVYRDFMPHGDRSKAEEYLATWLTSMFGVRVKVTLEAKP